jgi:hypothetical protein
MFSVTDGGGIRGYTSLCIFDELEKKIKGKLDARNLNDIYSEDCIRRPEVHSILSGI